MASDVISLDRKYFNMKRFEDAILNKDIERQKRINRRRHIRTIDKIVVSAIVASLILLILIVLKLVITNIEIAKRNNTIATLEIALDKKVFDNDAILDSMKDDLKYENLKMKAYLELNMITPTDKNIIYFDKSEANAIHQKEN